MNMAKVTWAFDITAGSEVVDTSIETAYGEGFLTAPLKFPVKFIPRSEVHKEIIMREIEGAKALFARFEN